MLSLWLLGTGFACGLLAKQFAASPKQLPMHLNTYIINVALPAMILLKVPALVLDHHALMPIGIAWGVILSSAAFVLLCSTFFGWSRAVCGALLVVVPLSNSAYFGLPLISTLLDDDVVRFALLYDQFGNFFRRQYLYPYRDRLLK